MSPRSWSRCLLAMLALTGCATKWVVQDAPAAEVIAFDDGDDYLVTRKNGEQLQLHAVRMEHDSIFGVEKDDPTGPPRTVGRAIALTDVRWIAVRTPDGVAMTFWIVVAGLGVGVLAFGAFMSAAFGS